MRYVIRWEQTTTRSTTVEISLFELSTWATATLPLRGLGIDASPQTPTVKQLEQSITENTHLRDRLLQLYGAAHTEADCSTHNAPRIIGVDEAPNPLANSVDRNH